MATKRRTPRAPVTLVSLPIEGLERRVTALEHDVHSLRTGMHSLSQEMSALKHAVKQVDERAMRGERLMMEMQVEQLRMAKTLDRIAHALQVPPLEDTKKAGT